MATENEPIDLQHSCFGDGLVTVQMVDDTSFQLRITNSSNQTMILADATLPDIKRLAVSIRNAVDLLLKLKSRKLTDVAKRKRPA